MKARLVVSVADIERPPMDPTVVLQSGEHLIVEHGLDLLHLGTKPIEDLTVDDFRRFGVQGLVISEVRELDTEDIYSAAYRRKVREWLKDFLHRLAESGA